jgi:hypothetical protein
MLMHIQIATFSSYSHVNYFLSEVHQNAGFCLKNVKNFPGVIPPDPRGGRGRWGASRPRLRGPKTGRTTFIQESPPMVRVHFIGLGGATLHTRRGSRCVFDFVEEAMRFRPDVLFLHVGENDLTTASITVQDLVYDYHSFANEFLSRHVSRVIISEPLSFPAQVRHHDTLSELRSLLRQRYSLVHSHNSNSIQLFRFSIPHRCFHSDRVHLS